MKNLLCKIGLHNKVGVKPLYGLNTMEQCKRCKTQWVAFKTSSGQIFWLKLDAIDLSKVKLSDTAVREELNKWART